MTDIKLDMDRTWLKSTTLWGALAITVTGTLLYARMDSAIRTIQQTIEHDAGLHEKDRTEIVGSIREVRDELRKLVSENVSQRQSGAWLTLFQLTWQAWLDKLRGDNPNLKVPDFKVPELPR
jgi:hypothetical protein